MGIVIVLTHRSRGVAAQVLVQRRPQPHRQRRVRAASRPRSPAGAPSSSSTTNSLAPCSHSIGHSEFLLSAGCWSRRRATRRAFGRWRSGAAAHVDSTTGAMLRRSPIANVEVTDRCGALVDAASESLSTPDHRSACSTAVGAAQAARYPCGDARVQIHRPVDSDERTPTTVRARFALSAGTAAERRIDSRHTCRNSARVHRVRACCGCCRRSV